MKNLKGTSLVCMGKGFYYRTNNKMVIIRRFTMIRDYLEVFGILMLNGYEVLI